MTFATATFTRSGSSSGNWQTTVTGVHALLAQADCLTQTGDSGQIDPSTTTPPSTSAYAGYEVWAFNDAVQASKPIFMKVEYGLGNLTSILSLRVTLGTGSDGAGTLTGVFQAAFAIAQGANTGTSHLLTADESGFLLILGMGGTLPTGITMLGVERSRDEAGVGDDRGATFHNGVSSFQAVDYPWSDVTKYTQWGDLHRLVPNSLNGISGWKTDPSLTISPDPGTIMTVFPVIGFATGAGYWKSALLATIFRSDVPSGNVGPVNLHGTEETFNVLIPNTNPGSPYAISGSTSVCIAVRAV